MNHPLIIFLGLVSLACQTIFTFCLLADTQKRIRRIDRKSSKTLKDQEEINDELRHTRGELMAIWFWPFFLLRWVARSIFGQMHLLIRVVRQK